MKQLLILSGKGGTGKTTLASAFIKLSDTRAMADCDVDAPNLHLVMSQTSVPQRSDYYGMKTAVIDAHNCIKCGLCEDHCQFNAIKDFVADPYSCEGCGVCEAICPMEAVSLKDSIAGELLLYKNDHVFSTGTLKMGSGTSGKLVTEVKNQLFSVSVNSELVIIDGSPGIGCPVIASISGVDMVLIVTEPSISGMSDLKRILQTVASFQVPAAVCVNKHDTNPENTARIISYCQEAGISFVGCIPFDPLAVEAINNGYTIADIECPSGSAAPAVFARTIKKLKSDGLPSSDTFE